MVIKNSSCSEYGYDQSFLFKQPQPDQKYKQDKSVSVEMKKTYAAEMTTIYWLFQPI